ncbi:MAG: 4-hydroxythreonine-4-phosphate dehydrogenase PdxA [Cytophagales bacterium]|nr:MAG: 4-hydroxythreonine-4-phosphate dehydrogenase PdxA [Cytophagales bacterium]TAF59381.1 MAG: 4-hydroxythreonine-4-phosphate dehydrogenase PdxA [Cytophagales bacterium]
MTAQSHPKLRLGITIGDFNGIGPEVIIKTLKESRIQSFCVPIIFGSAKVFAKHRKILDIEFPYQIAQTAQPEHTGENKVYLINSWPNDNPNIELGQSSAEAGQCALAALKDSVKALQEGWIDAVVTAPINKFNIQDPDFKFVGHTEFYEHHFSGKSLMTLVAEKFRIATLTGHIPISKVSQSITAGLLYEKLKVFSHTLKHDFGIAKPKIAVLGLNPHAGEQGLLGAEEQSIIAPTLEKLREEGYLMLGPFPSDGFFGQMSQSKFDGVMGMYHDQSLIPFKTLAFDRGVNFTAGLNIVRTSPDHGTAYNIAGKGIADPTPMREAIFLAADIASRRTLKVV